MLDNLILVLQEHSSEPIGIHNHLIQDEMLATGDRTILEHFGWIHVITQPETMTCFLCDGKLITCDHLNLNTKHQCIINGLLSIHTRRIEDSQKTNMLTIFESSTVPTVLQPCGL